MTGLVRARYTLEFKQEAVRLVWGGQTVSSVAKTLGLSDQTLHNWLKAEAAGGLREITGKVVSAEKMEIARLKTELAKTRMERDILKKATTYLAVVIDLFSRQVVGFAMSERMTRQLVIDVLRMAWFRRRPTNGLIFHSDRGSQYASGDFQKQLVTFGMKGSMSRKGDCWDCENVGALGGPDPCCD